MKLRLAIPLAALVVAIQGCGFSPVVRSFNATNEELPKAIERIAITGTDTIKDKLSFSLAAQGFQIFDPKPFAEIDSKYNIEKEDLTPTYDLDKLRSEGIDAIVTVSAEKSELGDMFVDSIYVKVIATDSGQMICGVEYNNGYAGMPGSPADAAFKESLNESAKKVVASLLTCITPRRANT